MKLTTGHVVVVLVVLVVGLAAATNTNPLTLVSQTHLTIHVSPSQSVYAPNQQVTVSGTLTCSGLCPMAVAQGYQYMDVKLSGSWGWSITVQTNGAGLYSTQVALPYSANSYQISAVFYQNGSPSASATVSFSVNANAVVTTTSTAQSSAQTSVTARTSGLQTVTKATTTTSTGTSTSMEYSTSHTTTTITNGTGTGTPNVAGIEDFLKATTTVAGYDIPNWYFVAGFTGLVVLIWLLRRGS